MTTYTNDYSANPEIIDNEDGTYIIHSSNTLSLSFHNYAYIRISTQIVDDYSTIDDFGSTSYFGLMNDDYNLVVGFAVSDDMDNIGISSLCGFGGMLYSGGGNHFSDYKQFPDFDWHKLEIEVNDTTATFTYDNSLIDTIYDVSGLSNIKWFGVKTSYGGYHTNDIDEWDGSFGDMHFKHRRTDNSHYHNWRWDDLYIDGGSTPVVISNTSGCTTSGGTTATISAKVTDGSGNVTWYYESGVTGGGETQGDWESNSSYGSIVYSGEYITKELTGLNRGYTYSFRGYISSNGWDGGEDWFDATDTFTTTPADTTSYDEGESLRIYVSCNNYPNNYIDCWCTRFDEDNWGGTIETFMGSGSRNFLFNNVTPGAVRELYNILGTPKFIDTTYESGNTLIISPISGYGLSSLREERTVAVKSISDTFINWEKFNVKIEFKRLDI